MTTLPDCFDCKYGGGEFPCRKTDGTFNFEKTGAAMIAAGRIIATADPDATEPPSLPEAIAWVTDCEYEIAQDYPDLIHPLVIAAADACETAQDAAYLAAGVLESALVKHGPVLIDRVEALAAQSPKYRYILSGVWSQGGSMRSDIWERVLAASGTDGVMSGDRPSGANGECRILSDDEAAALMKERVASVALRLKA